MRRREHHPALGERGGFGIARGTAEMCGAEALNSFSERQPVPDGRDFFAAILMHKSVTHYARTV